ncbi:MAG: response regulator [Lachnospiraceae bacterium]|nr:response regulator [Lachnospiraceae bacterium]
MNKVLIILVIILIAGLILWWIKTGSVLRRQQREIQKLRQEAKGANRAKTRFLANISKELLVPINTILGMDEMILRDDSKDVPKTYHMSMVNYALDIRRSAESLLGLVGGLLEMSRIEAGGMELDEQEYDTRELFLTVITMCRLRSDGKGIAFNVSIDEILPKRLYGDAGKIRQILLNLLTDAVSYTDMGSVSLSVSVEERRDNECRLSILVGDTGMGMKEAQLEKIRSVLENVDEKMNDKSFAEDSGLGISGAFASLMGGKLECRSTYGEGTEFILTLAQKIIDPTPVGSIVETETTAQRGAYAPQFVAPDGDVLIVDDDRISVSVIKGLLKPTGVFVTTAVSGEECIEKIREKKYNIVLLGHVSGKADAWETIEKIREEDTELPVYALTTNLSAGSEYYSSRGFTGYISKPVDSIQLERTIMRHIPENMMEKQEETPEEAAARLRKRAVADFIDTIDENVSTLRKYYENKDMEAYGQKVHSIGWSAMIVAAADLVQLCKDMEKAVSEKDTAYVEANAEKLIAEYKACGEKLRGEKG